MKKKLQQSFTLIELLIVIGILAVLVVTILITLNPSEAQKKARDLKRMKDMATLSAILLQYLNDGNSPTGAIIASGGTGSWGLGNGNEQCDGTTGVGNWLGINVCNYTKTVPADPLNGTVGSCVNAGTATAPLVTTPCSFRYHAKISGSDYYIRVKQESKSNANNVFNDGGLSIQWAESASDMSISSGMGYGD